jgi:hypothetical protein
MMKLIIENWRKYVNEMTTVEDYHFVVTSSPDVHKVEVVKKEGENLVPVISKIDGKESYIQIAKRTDVDHYEVASVAAPEGSKGVGLTLYKIALELASDEGLSPDSLETSQDALKIWDILMKDPDITRTAIDPYENENDPLNNVFYKQTKDVIPSLGDKITFQEKSGKTEEPPEPEPEPFGIEDWDDLYDIGVI